MFLTFQVPCSYTHKSRRFSEPHHVCFYTILSQHRSTLVYIFFQKAHVKWRALQKLVFGKVVKTQLRYALRKPEDQHLAIRSHPGSCAAVRFWDVGDQSHFTSHRFWVCFCSSTFYRNQTAKFVCLDTIHGQDIQYMYVDVIYQGIVGCSPTNVPLWEIPI